MKWDDIARANRVDRYIRVVTIIEDCPAKLNRGIAEACASLLNDGFYISTVSFGAQLNMADQTFAATVLANRRFTD